MRGKKQNLLSNKRQSSGIMARTKDLDIEERLNEKYQASFPQDPGYDIHYNIKPDIRLRHVEDFANAHPEYINPKFNMDKPLVEIKWKQNLMPNYINSMVIGVEEFGNKEYCFMISIKHRDQYYHAISPARTHKEAIEWTLKYMNGHVDIVKRAANKLEHFDPDFL